MFARRMVSVYVPVLVLCLAGLTAGTAKAGTHTPQECCESVHNLQICVDVDGHVFCNGIDIDLCVFVNIDEILDLVEILECETLEELDEIASEKHELLHELLDVDCLAWFGNVCYYH